MHRIMRTAVSLFIAIHGYFALSMLEDRGVISDSLRSGLIVVLFFACCAVRALMYGAAKKRGEEPRPVTRNSVTGETLAVLCGVVYAWLLLAILVGTGAVGADYQAEAKTALGWASLFVLVVTVISHTIGLRKIRSGAQDGGSREPRPMAPTTNRSEEKDLIHHGQA